MLSSGRWFSDRHKQLMMFGTLFASLSFTSRCASFHTKRLLNTRTISTPPSPRSHRRYARRSSKSSQIFRADRVLANRTGKSRKECFQLLTQRRVYNADGQSVPGPSTRIPMHTALTIDRREHSVPLPPPLLMVYHKPTWVLSVRRDPQRRPCIGEELLPDMHPVGRLDYDTSGLLLLSSSGALTQVLLHPKHGVEKEYSAIVSGMVQPSLRQQLRDGVETGVGIVTARLLEAAPITDASQVERILDAEKEALPTSGLRQVVQRDLMNVKELSRVRLVVKGGKHRVVRRMLANVGHPVVKLHRERMGGISLGDVPVGETRPLTPDELVWAEKTAKRKVKKESDDDIQKQIGNAVAESIDMDEEESGQRLSGSQP